MLQLVDLTIHANGCFEGLPLLPLVIQGQLEHNLLLQRQRTPKQIQNKDIQAKKKRKSRDEKSFSGSGTNLAHLSCSELNSSQEYPVLAVQRYWTVLGVKSMLCDW